MKLTPFLTLMLCFVFARPAFTEEAEPLDPRWKQLSQAFGFLLGQQDSIDMIGEKFPDLSPQIKLSWYAFQSSALGESMPGVEKLLEKEVGGRWPEMRKQLVDQSKKLAESQDVTEEQASAFLDEVKKRSKGEGIPEPIRSTLLSANPRYMTEPSLEIVEGWKNTYRTKDHPKAKGVDFSISLPSRWYQREGNRPNIIQFFRSDGGHGPAICNLMVKDLPLPEGYEITRSELEEFFAPSELKGMIPDGVTLIEAQSIVMEGMPAGKMVFDHTMQQLDVVMTMRMTQYVTILDKKMIIIQFVVSEQEGTDETLDELQKRYSRTCRTVANSFVYNDRYP